MRRVETVENNVKCGDIFVFGHKFYLLFTKYKVWYPSNFVPAVGILSKEFVPGDGVFERKM